MTARKMKNATVLRIAANAHAVLRWAPVFLSTWPVSIPMHPPIGRASKYRQAILMTKSTAANMPAPITVRIVPNFPSQTQTGWPDGRSKFSLYSTVFLTTSNATVEHLDLELSKKEGGVQAKQRYEHVKDVEKVVGDLMISLILSHPIVYLGLRKKDTITEKVEDQVERCHYGL
mmetsp:Transcript_26335/g.49188  ORF Transcript_26335/g.49188 Transcript_26335/m.49188 type:complete len:174 (+) Transcript_26335:772-1293(+)